MQRERRFEQYQDDGVFYEKRPDVWVEPKGNWGKGAVMLVEIPTEDETSDNIVAFWSPADKPQKGQELLYAYRLNWCRENPVVVDLARVYATRTASVASSAGSGLIFRGASSLTSPAASCRGSGRTRNSSP